MAYASTNMESVSAISTSLVMLNSLAIDCRAGATIDDETGEMKVNEETMKVAAHFLLKVQFLGFAESSGPSHVTYPSRVSLKRTLRLRGAH
jgi:hypothetical protein